MAELLYANEVYQIVGAAMEVQKQLLCGFLESVYQEAMELEFGWRNIPFVPRAPLHIHYKGVLLEKFFVADLVCYGKILVELKAIQQTTEADEAQVLNYLRCTGLRLGLLINFGRPGQLDWSRIVL